MGSFHSKAPAPQPVYYYAPSPDPVVSTPSGNPGADGAGDGSGGGSGGGTDGDKVAGVIRRRSLPQTILTSYRGVLSQGEWMPARKSLLGE